MQKFFMQVATTLDGKIDLFGHDGQAKMYREFRPVYPESLINFIVSLVPKRVLYVDVACGSGQLTKLIAPYFQETLGIDQSLEQLSQTGETLSGVCFTAGSAFDLQVGNSSVDLITVAQALHWLLPYDRFFSEVMRVLKPGGVFVTVAYAFPRLLDSAARAEVEGFYFGVLGADKSPGEAGCWWETDRPTIDGFYSEISFPRPPTTYRFIETVSMTLEHYMNYLRTLSAYRTLLRSGALKDPLPELEKKLRSFFGSERVIQVEIPFFAVMFKNE